MKQYEIVLHGYDGEEVIVNEKFNTIKEAMGWVDWNEYSFQDIKLDENGDDYWATECRIFNPEDDETYYNYHLQECTQMSIC